MHLCVFCVGKGKVRAQVQVKVVGLKVGEQLGKDSPAAQGGLSLPGRVSLHLPTPQLATRGRQSRPSSSDPAATILEVSIYFCFALDLHCSSERTEHYTPPSAQHHHQRSHIADEKEDEEKGMTPM